MQSKVIIDTTGGTIESKYVPKVGITPVKNKYETIEIAGYELPLYEICRLDSTDIDDRIRNKKIGPTIVRQANEGYNVIVYHGTDTLADTAGIIGYNLFGNNRRIIITGALYPPDFPKSDVEKNKRDSVIFAMKGYGRSGVFVVMGGSVLSPFLWSNHYWRAHDPVIELLRLSDEKGVFEKFEIELHEPFAPIAKIRGEEIIYGFLRPTYDETTYLRVDDEFRISKGGEGKVRSLDFRGSAPYTGEIPEINDIISEYGRLKEIALNSPERKDEALTKVEKLLKDLNLDPKIFTVYWKDLKIHFDPRTNLEEILVIGDPYSNPLAYIKGIKDGIWAGIVIRGVGYGHIKLNKKWKKVLKTARNYGVPVSIVTDEGLITSNEYAVAKPLHKEKVNPSGTLSAKEAQIRKATGIGNKKKRKFMRENVAEIFGLDPLNIFSAFYVSGMLFKDSEQRNDWAKKFRYSTNIDVAFSPLFKWEEKMLLSGLNHAYVSGKTPRYKWI